MYMKNVYWMALVLLSGTAIAQPCPPLEEYDAIAAIVTEQFFDRTFRGLDWDARVAHYRSSVTCDVDERAVSSAVNGLLAELNVSHTAVYTADDLDYWAINSVFATANGDLDAFEIDFSGIWPERRDGKWFAKYVLFGSPAHRAGVLAGDELISLDGEAFHPLGFEADGPTTLSVSSDGVRTRDVSFQAIRQSTQRAFLESSERSSRIVSVGNRQVGYFHLWSGQSRALELMNATLGRFEDERIDAMILDFRGGYGAMGSEYLDTLRESRYLMSIPKYFLIDDGVRSGKELLAQVVRTEQIGTLVGSRTAGAYLGGLANRLFDNRYFLLLAASDDAIEEAAGPTRSSGDSPDMSRVEGRGIEPDELVEPCRAYCAGSDPQFDRAIELVGQMRL